MMKPALEEAGEKLRGLVEKHSLADEHVEVTVGTLTTKQAIGTPSRKDYPLLEGREVMIEAQFRDSYGQAFTDRPHDFSGSLRDILSRELTTNDDRAIFVATTNAVLSYLQMVTGVRHCRDEEPEECAAEIAQYILKEIGSVKAGLAGCQPAILENLAKVFGPDNVRCTDMNPNNIGVIKAGVELWDGKTRTSDLIDWCDLLLVTSSTLVNGTFDAIRGEADARNKRLIIFGVTGSGIAALLGLERLCYRAH